jgi:hypothetical protein
MSAFHVCLGAVVPSGAGRKGDRHEKFAKCGFFRSPPTVFTTRSRSGAGGYSRSWQARERSAMSTGAIVAIVIVAVLLLIVFAVLLPRMRAKAEERRIASRREEVAGAHREEASTYAARAEYAERDAQRERAEADLHEATARLHEQGLADDQLDAEHERLTGDERRDPAVDRPARS